MSTRMRATMHNKRTVSSAHNDRRFDYESADNIDESRTHLNLYWTCYDGWYQDDEKEQKRSFKEVETLAYESKKTRARKAYEEQCKKNISRGQARRNKSFEDWCNSPRHRAEETSIQVGKKSDFVDPKLLLAAAKKHIAWLDRYSRSHDDLFTLTSVAFHVDETCYHLQFRKIWRCDMTVDKALAGCGFDLPEPNKKPGRYNNRKISFDQLARKHWIDCLESVGFDVERTPRSGRKKSKTKSEYLDDLVEENERLKEKLERQLKNIELDKQQAYKQGVEHGRKQAMRTLQLSTRSSESDFKRDFSQSR